MEVFMKKIDVITLHNIKNYGSVLQTYATQKVLKDLNYDVEFINYYRDGKTVSEIVENNIKFSTIYNKNFLFHFIGKIILTNSIRKQVGVFNKFLSENINLSRDYFSYEEIKNDIPVADIYCSGSDQVWNSDWNQQIDKTFFLDFLPNNAKRISFSSSIGKSEIDENESKVIIPMLKKYSYITVREQSAVDLLKSYNIDAKLVLDPTLMLNKNEWIDFCSSEKIDISGKYILVYQLNSKFEEFNNYVKYISKKLNLPVIRVSVFSHQKIMFGKFVHCPSVKAFLQYILNAEYVITDSFHCTAFSINLNKKFMSIYPPKFPTRLENILCKTNLLDRKITSINDCDKIDEDIDYKVVNNILEVERKKSLKTIKEMIKNI